MEKSHTKGLTQTRRPWESTGRDWNDAATGQEKPGDGSVVKSPPANVAVAISVSESGRSPEEGNGNPLQYSSLENPVAEGPGGYSPRGGKESDMTKQLTHKLGE